MNELRKAYHLFLRSPAAKFVDPDDLCNNLRARRILDDDEVELIRNERTLTLRQYCLFLKLLPRKGAFAKEAVHLALLDCGYERAAAELAAIFDDGFIVPKVADQFYAEPCRYFVGAPQTSQPQSAAPPPGWILPHGLAGRSSESPNRLWQCSINRSQRDFNPPGAPPFVQPCADGKLEPTEDEEPRVVAYKVIGLGAPPPLPTSSGYGSEGITAKTPDSLAEGEPKFVATRVGVELTEGTIKISEVALGTEIGRGFFAVVYVAQYANRKVAVKKFRDYDEFTLNMFLDEVNIMKDLNHRNVVKYVGYAHSPLDKHLWLITEFIPGGSLRRFCTPTGGRPELERSLALRDKLKVTSDCWQGLDYLHRKNLFHKDISPGNVLVSNDLAQVKISDFGLAEFKDVIMTAVTQVSGTPMYYPPEFASEDGIIRHPVKSDVYSMGASLCELFSEQWFWNIQGQPRNQFQVMFVLTEQQRLWAQQGVSRDPDCWAKIPPIVQPMLKDAITPDYKQRKSAHQLYVASQDILKDVT